MTTSGKISEARQNQNLEYLRRVSIPLQVSGCEKGGGVGGWSITKNEAEAENSDSMRFSHYSYAVTNVAISFSRSDLLCCHCSTFLC